MEKDVSSQIRYLNERKIANVRDSGSDVLWAITDSLSLILLGQVTTFAREPFKEIMLQLRIEIL